MNNQNIQNKEAVQKFLEKVKLNKNLQQKQLTSEQKERFQEIMKKFHEKIAAAKTEEEK